MLAGMSRIPDKPDITPDLVLSALAAGYFPMAESRQAPDLHWYVVQNRGVLPLEAFHVPRRLARTVRRDVYRVTVNRAFREVMELCAEPAPDRPQTWINDQIIDLYTELHRMGHGHSVEAWQGARLVGGLYGVALGAAFFGESMFSRATDASKVALVHLVARLKAGGFSLLDAQFLNRHLLQFGAVEVSRHVYEALLETAIRGKADFYSLPADSSGASVLQSITQTS
jgi:leucyl/phenylalanyl-tRNA--protein transferase